MKERILFAAIAGLGLVQRKPAGGDRPRAVRHGLSGLLADGDRPLHPALRARRAHAPEHGREPRRRAGGGHGAGPRTRRSGRDRLDHRGAGVLGDGDRSPATADPPHHPRAARRRARLADRSPAPAGPPAHGEQERLVGRLRFLEIGLERRPRHWMAISAWAIAPPSVSPGPSRTIRSGAYSFTATCIARVKS